MHRRMRWLIVAALLISIAVIVTHARRVKKTTQTAAQPIASPQPFVVRELPEALTVDAFEERAVASRKAVILGQAVNPLYTAQALTLPPLRDVVTQAAAQVSPDPEFAGYLTAIFAVESGGDANAQSGAGAVGLAQLMPGTARDYGLTVDRRRYGKLVARQRLLRRMPRLSPLWQSRVRAELETIKSTIPLADERLNPYRSALAGAKHLARLERRFGNLEWAVQAYHSGEGNIAKIVRLYTAGHLPRYTASGELTKGDDWSIATTITRNKLSWSQVVRDALPAKHPLTTQTLYGLKDWSWDYSLKVKAWRQCLDLYRTNPQAFEGFVGLYKNHDQMRSWHLADERLWYPEEHPKLWRWRSVNDLKEAFSQGVLIEIPNNPAFAQKFGIRLGSMGNYVDGADDRAAYKRVRPETAGLGVLIAGLYRQWPERTKSLLTVTSLVRCQTYQAAIRKLRLERLSEKQRAKRLYSCHREGVSLDLAFPRDASGQQDLERTLTYLRYAGYVVWKRERDHYHVTLSPERREVLQAFWQDALASWKEVDPESAKRLSVASRRRTPPVWEFLFLVLIVVGTIAYFRRRALGTKRLP